jgi:hypothetical protein
MMVRLLGTMLTYLEVAVKQGVVVNALCLDVSQNHADDGEAILRAF